MDSGESGRGGERGGRRGEARRFLFFRVLGVEEGVTRGRRRSQPSRCSDDVPASVELPASSHSRCAMSSELQISSRSPPFQIRQKTPRVPVQLAFLAPRDCLGQMEIRTRTAQVICCRGDAGALELLFFSSLTLLHEAGLVAGKRMNRESERRVQIGCSGVGVELSGEEVQKGSGVVGEFDLVRIVS